jgi:integrator complex subunit 11
LLWKNLAIIFFYFYSQSTKYPVKPTDDGLLSLESVTIKLEGTDIEDRKSMFISWALQVID